MMIDCDSCTVRGAACTDCVVTFLTIPVRPTDHGRDGRREPGGTAVSGATRAASGASGATYVAALPVDLDDDERAAIDVLAASGLVPPLRMVRAV